MYLEMEIARDRVAKLRVEAEQYRLGQWARSGDQSVAKHRGGRWTRLFAASRWGGSHRRSEQLM